MNVHLESKQDILIVYFGTKNLRKQVKLQNSFKKIHNNSNKASPFKESVFSDIISRKDKTSLYKSWKDIKWKI